MYFVPLLKGFLLELGIGIGGQTRGLPGQERRLISSAVLTQSTNVTDRQTLGNSKDTSYA